MKVSITLDIQRAAWTRVMNDYGHVDDRTPSLAISANNMEWTCSEVQVLTE